jgi:hypothetical protein
VPPHAAAASSPRQHAQPPSPPSPSSARARLPPLGGAIDSLRESKWGTVVLAFLIGLGLASVIAWVIEAVCQQNGACNWILAALFFAACLGYAGYVAHRAWAAKHGGAEPFVNPSAAGNNKGYTDTGDACGYANTSRQWGYDPAAAPQQTFAPPETGCSRIRAGEKTTTATTTMTKEGAAAAAAQENLAGVSMWQFYSPQETKVCYRPQTACGKAIMPCV